ncbi:pentapeptide repeat-containing protein [Streptomyces sp. NPDC048332]|uniref:pentapeptide repeat-containing protein n=1 Tax=Streptomyces sp. NPDC048332 TaxID=3154619 RepID=UPI0034255373
MNFNSWADWLRAAIGAIVTYGMMRLVWRLVAKAAAFSDPHQRAGRHIILIPRLFVRPRTEKLKVQLRISTALRRHQGISGPHPTAQVLRQLVELDRAKRLLIAGRLIWARLVPTALIICGISLGAWFALIDNGPDGSLLHLPSLLEPLLGSGGWHTDTGGECVSWTLLRGCEVDIIPWWSGVESGFAFGCAMALLPTGWAYQRAATREFNVLDIQEPPLSNSVTTLIACRDFLRSPNREAIPLDVSVATLGARLRDFARTGLPVDADRRLELNEHALQVAGTLHATTGRLLRGEAAAMPTLIEQLATIQDRMYESRWLELLDPSLLSAPPAPAPVPTLAPAASTAASDLGRWQRYTVIATALPTIPALLALAFTAATIVQTKDALKITERDQVTSAYNDTVSNLDEESNDVRLSAIYAIQRIMRESPDTRPALVEVLSSYVRKHAKMPEKSQATRMRKDQKTRPPDDVQAALTVLGERETEISEDPVIDLRDTFLVGADLTGLNFYNADLRGVDLTRAVLQDGSFANAWFDGGKMSQATLTNGDFDDAEFIGTDLRNSWSDGASFDDAILVGANLEGAIFYYPEDSGPADLSGVDFSGANLKNANLTNAYLAEADFSEDRDQGLPVAKINGANFTKANLTNAILDGVDRRYAIWKGAILP